MGARGAAARRWPVPVSDLGIDSDNGSEFINADLLAYCHARQITFTRSRPGNKNDGAHVEQKNWARVRELVGYYRYDTAAELEKLNEDLGHLTRFSRTTCCRSRSWSPRNATEQKSSRNTMRRSRPTSAPPATPEYANVP